MNDFREIAVKVAAVCVGLLVIAVVVEVLLPRIARAATLFIGTPGGLLLIILAWRYLARRRSH